MVMKIRHELTAVNGIRMHFVTAGQGPALYLLHGWPQDWFEWEPFLEPLAKNHTLVVPDLRGFGESEKPVGGYDLETQSRDIIELAKSLSHDRIVLIAHDLGGPVAYAVAASHPSLVAGVLLFEAPIFGIVHPAVPDFERDLWHFGLHACRDLAESLISGNEEIYLSHFFREFSYRKDAFSESLMDRFVRVIKRPGALRGGLEHYRSIPQSKAQIQRWMTNRLDIPIGGFGGSHSLGNSVYESAKLLSHHGFGGTIDRCGHWVCEERPDYVLDQIQRLCSEISSW